jgi:hypothetical protein
VEEYLGRQWLAKRIPPPFEAIRTERYLYVEYRSGWRELYDLRTDPNEVTNLAARPADLGLRHRMAEALRLLLL